LYFRGDTHKGSYSHLVLTGEEGNGVSKSLSTVGRNPVRKKKKKKKQNVQKKMGQAREKT